VLGGEGQVNGDGLADIVVGNVLGPIIVYLNDSK
jgi:hypothetical protein